MPRSKDPPVARSIPAHQTESGLLEGLAGSRAEAGMGQAEPGAPYSARRKYRKVNGDVSRGSHWLSLGYLSIKKNNDGNRFITYRMQSQDMRLYILALQRYTNAKRGG